MQSKSDRTRIKRTGISVKNPLRVKKPRSILVKNPPEKKPGVWTIGFNIGLWVNQHLMKDVGLVPYMFHQVYGFRPAILGCEQGEYSYLKILPGMRLEPLPADPGEYFSAAMAFLHEHAQEMDLLCLFGPYPFYRDFLREYRRLRPDGKVYMALDANIYWVDRIQWTDPGFCEILDACDVIATSGHSLQRHLNRKWNRWVINYIPNGFFNPTGRDISVSQDQKENILLTVGRIGIPEKSHHVLLEAFAMVHEEIGDWRVHLVGGVEDSFQSYVNGYFERFPALREKVFLKGLIEDKNELYEQYAKAKVFVLTSGVEGGAPNVIGEALFHGCYMITSTIDAAEDITNGGTCGRIFPIGNVNALADIFRSVCLNEAGWKEAFERSRAYAANHFDWEVIIKRLHHLLYGE